MNDYQFRYLLEQLQKQEERSEQLDERMHHLANDMKIMVRSIKILTKKLVKTTGSQAQLGKKRKVPPLNS